jgi:hypothetical protein
LAQKFLEPFPVFTTTSGFDAPELSVALSVALPGAVCPNPGSDAAPNNKTATTGTKALGNTLPHPFTTDANAPEKSVARFISGATL